MPFCGICTEPIAVVTRREPIGKDDGLVAVCDQCANDHAEVIDAPRRVRPPDVEPGMLSRADTLTAYRKRLYDEGACMNGRKHGPRVGHKRLCQACLDREAERNRARKAAP